MSRAVIYCRVSSEEQTKNMSLPNQRKACLDYCQRNGYEVDRVFVEEGASAKTTDRPQFQALLQHCREQKGRVAFVVVWKVDRFSRDRLDHALVVSLLQGLGIRLRSVTEPIDDTSTGRLMEGILSAFAQFDNDVRGERTAAGMKAALEAGRVVHVAPLGYLNTTGPAGEPTIKQDPARAPLIRLGFEMFATGLHGKAEIMEQLTKRGLRTLKGNKLHKQSFGQYLRNPIYAGWIVSKKWGLKKRGSFEPIVDQATFDKVQALLDGSVQAKVPHARSNPDFPLRAFVRCGHCGRPLTGSKSTGRDGKKRAYYHCTGCHETRERKEGFEAAFLGLLEGLQPTPEAAKLLRALVLQEYEREQTATASATSTAEARVAELEARKDKLVEAYIYKGALDEATYKRHLDKLSEEITLARMTATDAEVDALDIEATLAFAEQVLTNLGRLWLNYGLDQRQRLQKIVFPNGLTWQNGAFGNIVSAPIFRVIPHIGGAKRKLAPQEGLEPST